VDALILAAPGFFLPVSNSTIGQSSFLTEWRPTDMAKLNMVVKTLLMSLRNGDLSRNCLKNG